MTRPGKPTLKLKLMHSDYQPSKAELEEDVSIDASPEDIAYAVLRPVEIVYVDPPEPKKEVLFRRPKK